MATEKHETPATKPSAPAAKQEDPKATVQALLASYLHNYEHNAPRTIEELRMLQDLAANA